MKRTLVRVAMGVAAFIGAHGAQATQTVVPTVDATGTLFTAAGANSWSTSIAGTGGESIVFFGRYNSDNASESGLGLKIQYDPAKITSVTIDQVVTKCMVFTPDVSVSGQVLFGWADTSQRAAGAVGWPSLVDGTPPCLNPAPPAPAIATTTAAFTVPTTLFRFTATTAAGFQYGNSTITLSSPSASSAGGAAAFTNTSLVLIAPAPPCNLDVDGSTTVQTFVDGILIVRNMLGITGANLTSGLTIPGPNNTPAGLQATMAANNYDVDGSGTTQTFVDGIILVRLMLGISDTNLLNGITLPQTATFTTAAAIRANVNAKCGTSF